jgi:hypothetical protein
MVPHRFRSIFWRLLTRHRGPLAGALILALSIAVVSAVLNPSSAFAYGCTQHLNGPCYALGRWGGANGSRTTMSIANVTCSGCTPSSNWQVLDTMWLADTSSWAVNSCFNAACWVEVGTWTDADQRCGTTTTMCYYWADERPCGGGYHNHFGYTAAYDIGQSAISTIQLGQNRGQETCNVGGAVPNTTWSVSETSLYWGNGFPAGLSTSNPMKPTYIDIGGEVNALNGVTNPTTTWTNNQYWFSGPWGNQTSAGSAVVNAPWNGGWINLTSPNWQATCNCQMS